MYLLGYDIGSSSVKASVLDVSTGRCVASAAYPPTEAPIKALHPGWAEQSPAAWWHYIKEATASVLSQGVEATDIAAIGISYQMHGLVAVDKNGEPLRDAIIWCDSRAVAYGEKAFDAIGHDKCLEHMLNSPGNFTASKLAWVKDCEPHIYERIYKAMLPGDYVAMRLTGECCTTVEGLSEYVLWDFCDNAPSSLVLDYFGVDKALLPEICDTFGIQGRVTASAAAELGLREGTPVTYRAGDQPNNALSLNVLEPRQIAATAGTSGVVYGIIDEVKYDSMSRVNNFAHVNHTQDKPRIGVLACINGTGILNSWMRRNIAPEGMSYAQMNEAAAGVPAGSEGLAILPFGNGAERLLCNSTPGCSMHGINFNIHTRAHLLRAAQEGIAFAFMYGIEIMEDMGLKVDRIHAGNANMFLSPVFRQTLADISGAVIELVDTDGALGAARGAGIGAGIYKNAAEAFATLDIVDTIVPGNGRQAVKEAYGRWKEILLTQF